MDGSPIGLYIHIPWCVRKCPYCDFNSHPAPMELPADRYAAALVRDLDEELARAADRTVASVFFGGGTPSLFPPEVIASILDAARSRLRVAADAEVTLEANPGTVECGRFAEYLAAGVNRVSLGAQSFSAESLRSLGRIHSPRDTVRAVEELVAAGIENFNLDVMYALPRQTIAEAILDVSRAIELRPAHLSLYQLTLEPGTAFFSRPPALPAEDDAYEMQDACGGLLAAGGYEQYEVSAYARPGRQCRHNLNYWRFGDYIGIGAGAHGKLTQAGGAIRTERTKSPRAYLTAIEEGRSVAVTRTVPEQDLAFEFMLNALRLRSGFLESDFVAGTGLDFAIVADTMTRLTARGLLRRTDDRWTATRRGFDFLNELTAEFLPEQSPPASTAFTG